MTSRFRNQLIAGLIVLLGGGAIISAGYMHYVYPVQENPGQVVTADFNGDGLLDLAVSNRASNTVSVLVGQADGSFLPAVNYPAGQGTILGGIASADFNEDGNQDLAVVVGDVGGRGGTIAILLGNGDGTFQAPYFVPTEISPLSIAAADLNHDGSPDLFVGGNGNSCVLLGNGNGTFQNPDIFQIGEFGDTVAVAIADLNGDGNPDLISAEYTDNQVGVLLGDGEGKFSQPRLYNSGPTPNGVIAADFNGDGVLDLAVSNYQSNAVSVLPGVGNGRFGSPVHSAAGGISPTTVAAANINGDGELDLVVGNYGPPGSVSILVGLGNGKFRVARQILVGENTGYLVLGAFGSKGRLGMAVSDSGGDTLDVFSNVPK
jgi:hypothetical protein